METTDLLSSTISTIYETTENGFLNMSESENATIKSVKKNSNTVLPVVMLFLFGTVGNILALVVLLYTSKKHKWRTFYRLVGALAVSDFIGLFGTLPISMANYHNGKKWLGGQPLCDYMSFILIFSGMASALLACTMSLDRFLAVWLPHFYNHRVSKLRVNLFIFSVWCFAFLVACLPLFGINENIHQFPGTWCFFNMFAAEPEDKVFSYLYSFIGILAIASMIVMNGMVVIALSRRCGHSRRYSTSSTRKRKAGCSVNDVYNILFLVVLMVVFTICWVPLMVRVIINQIGGNIIDRKADLLVMRLSLVNQILDPWIYILLRKDLLIKCLRFAKRHARSGSILQKMNTEEDQTGSSTCKTTQSGSVTDTLEVSSTLPRDQKPML